MQEDENVKLLRTGLTEGDKNVLIKMVCLHGDNKMLKTVLS